MGRTGCGSNRINWSYYQGLCVLFSLTTSLVTHTICKKARRRCDRLHETRSNVASGRSHGASARLTSMTQSFPTLLRSSPIFTCHWDEEVVLPPPNVVTIEITMELIAAKQLESVIATNHLLPALPPPFYPSLVVSSQCLAPWALSSAYLI